MPAPPVATLVELLATRFRKTPHENALIFGGKPFSFGELWERAGRFGTSLVRRGVSSGDRIVVALPNGPDFFVAFYGSQRAGAVPVPVFPESGPERLADVAGHAGARVVVVPGDRPEKVSVSGLGDDAAVLTVTGAEAAPADETLFPRVAPEDLCFIQYTSGSTGNPKGVQLSHANVMANLKHLIDGMGITDRDVFVSWLPLYHDMGLVLMTMVPFFIGARLVLLPTRLPNIQAWLRAIEEHRGTFTAAPDFAYRFCLRYLRDPARFDLRSLRVALNAAEPVRARTIREFETCFGLDNVVMPGYGLAEATVGVSMWPPGTPVQVDSRGVVSVGPPFPGVEVRTMDGTRRTEAGETGEIQVRSAATTRGYFRNDRETELLMAGDGFIRTGDLGYLDDTGNLYVVDRKKDIIIHGGRNIAPGEVEEVVDRSSFVRHSAAVGIERGDLGGEQVYVFAEVGTTPDGERGNEEMIGEIVRGVHGRFGLRPGRVYLLARRGIPRTPNGKIQRGLLRKQYLSGSLRQTGQILFPDY